MKNPNELEKENKSWATMVMSLILEDFAGVPPEHVAQRSLILSGSLLALAYNVSPIQETKEAEMLANQEMAGYVLDAANQLKEAFVTVEMDDGEYEKQFKRKK